MPLAYPSFLWHHTPWLWLFFSPSDLGLGTEGRAWLGDRGKTMVLCIPSHCLLPDFILLIYTATAEIISLMTAPLYKDFRWLPLCNAAADQLGTMQYMGWDWALLASDVFMSRWRIKIKLTNGIVNINNVTQNCWKHLLSPPFHTLKQIKEPRKLLFCGLYNCKNSFDLTDILKESSGTFSHL